ncbi:hypothetical protein BH18VER1_BH18VER1_12890 [soil metagenome]
MQPTALFGSNKERPHRSKFTMKTLSLIGLAAAVAFAVSCEKPQSEPERNAQIEREVQQRLAAERQADEQQRLADQQADLDAREQALSEKGAAAARAAASPPRAVAQTASSPRSTPARAAADTRAPKTYDTFYRKLEPYGAWRETNDYGYVWQPQQAQRSRKWRPYADGRWAYTDAGWTWVSEEPFGWATYHYGRWIQLRNVGWVWVPGDEWAPAWVSWRTSDEYVGWAPLPPEAQFDRRSGIHRWADSYYDIDVDEYVFVPTVAIGSARLVHEVVPVEQNVTIVNQTVNVTNITYNNVTVVNEGPDYEQIRRRSRQPMERLRLERQFNAETKTPQSVVRGDILAVTAPVFAAEAVGRPPVVGEPIGQVEPARASAAASANGSELRRAREKMKAEATAPSDAPSKRYQKPKMVAAAPAEAASPAASVITPASSPVASPSATMTPVPTSTPRASVAPTATATATATPTVTPLATATPSLTSTRTATASPRATIAPTATPVATPVTTPTPSATPFPTATATAVPAFSPRPRSSPRVSPVVSPTPAAEEPLSGSSGAADLPPNQSRGNRNGRRNAPPTAQPTPAAAADQSEETTGNTDEFSLGGDTQDAAGRQGRAGAGDNRGGAGQRGHLNRKPGRPALASPIVPTATTPPPPAVTPSITPRTPPAQPFTTPAATAVATATPTPTVAPANAAIAPAPEEPAEAAGVDKATAGRRQGRHGRGANKRERPAAATQDGDTEPAETAEPTADEP